MATSTVERPTLEDRDHLRDCPDPDRVESYLVRRPDNQGGGYMRVTRCQQCGGHVAVETNETPEEG